MRSLPTQLQPASTLLWVVAVLVLMPVVMLAGLGALTGLCLLGVRRRIRGRIPAGSGAPLAPVLHLESPQVDTGLRHAA